MRDIKDFLDKSMSMGLGLAAYTREKIEDLVEDLVRKGEVAQKDARAFAGNLVQKGEEQKEELKKMIHDEITNILDKMDLARKSDVEEKIRAAVQEAKSEKAAVAAPKPKTKSKSAEKT